jgi:prepilin-type N-terminal cleavage/methylation domain-containing protein
VRDERGFTLVELMVTIFIATIVFGAVLTMIEVSTRNQARVTARVDANQRARPVMTRLIDRLHSACVAPGIAPVLAGSTSSSMSFLSKSGSAVSPTPDLYTVTLSGTTLSESRYLATGGSAPSWTFSSTPTSTRQLIAGVGTGAIGSPPAAVPLFRYYKFIGGQVSTTPLPTPLSATDASRTVQVDVAFSTNPAQNGSRDANAAVTLADSATLRLEPASEDSSELNLPCV